MSLERREFETALGDIWLWGETEAFSGSKPLVFAILGAFNVEQRWPDHIPQRLANVSVVTAQLPGNHCPLPSSHSVEAYAEAFSAVLATMGRPAIVLGASIGGLAAFAMHGPNLRGIVALDPPLHTAGLWPLVGPFRQMLIDSNHEPRLTEFLWNVFGVGADRLEERDYSGLLEGLSVPTVVIVGEEPLQPVRELTMLPGLVEERDRLAYRRHPLVQLWRVGGVGHNIVNGGFSHVLDAIRWLMIHTGQARG